MGQNQLLLIILGMIIIGVMITVAIILMQENAVTANRDAVASDLLVLAAKGKQYYNTPASNGGGGHSFTGLTADASGMSKLASAGLSANGNGNYTIITPGTSSGVVFQGIGNVATSNGSWPTLTCSVTASGNTIAIVN
jgi:hypothetical protein